MTTPGNEQGAKFAKNKKTYARLVAASELFLLDRLEFRKPSTATFNSLTATINVVTSVTKDITFRIVPNISSVSIN
ncbi:MAG TPA: hypothetical protein V6C89_14750 [Drouetiella sp.]